MTPRIEPLSEPYAPDVAAHLDAMSPGTPPIRLFRTLVRNLPMTTGLHAWGSYYRGPQRTLSLRQRELVIDRTTARCGCEYEWGVHIARYATKVELTPQQITSLAHGSPTDPCWEPRDRAVIEAVDALHDTCTIDDELWQRLSTQFTDAQLLELLLLSGWYHAVSFTANAVRVDLEEWAPPSPGSAQPQPAAPLRRSTSRIEEDA
jgi:alkylhydroperoxidase family enzyme